MDVNECIYMIRRGEYDRAIWHLSRIVTREPDDPEIHSLKALALYRLGRYAKAIEACDRMQRLNDEYVQVYTNMLDDSIWNGKYDKARLCRLMADRMRYASIRAKYVKAKSLFRMGKRDEALYWINAELKMNPDDPNEHSILEMILSRMCLIDETHEPDKNVRSARVHGVLFHKFVLYQGDYMAKLEEDLDTAIFMARIQKGEAGAYVQVAEILRKLAEWPRALNMIDKAIKIDPQNVKYRYVRAEILRALNRKRDCDREIKAALAIDMYYPEAVALSGFRLCEKGYLRKGGARTRFAFGKDSINPVTCNYEAYAQFRTGDRDEALKICKSAMLRHPKNQELYFMLCDILDDMLNP